MDGDAKHHDFDQRHDGPFDQPEPRRSIQLPPLATSSPAVQSPSPSPATHGARSPMSPSGGKTLNWQDVSSPATGRKSMQGHRPSRDFDVRRDGPYGRPSITMSRRRSSGMQQLGNDDLSSRDQEGDLIAPDPAEIERGRSLGDATAGFEPEPPRLDYDMWSRKWFILFFWSMVFVDCVATPIVLYFTLHYLTDLSNNLVFTVVTAALGGVSIFEYFVRAWRLWKKDSTCRVAGESRWGRWAFDWFHWNFSLGWIAVMIELIIGTVQENPPIRLLAMPLPSMLFVFASELLIVDSLRFFQIPSPVRMSSIPKGAQLRPAIYTMIEDVVAVDGSGGTSYREALNRRYEASHVFRAMLRRLGVYWAFSAMACAVATTVLVFTIHDEAAFVIGWTLPFLWAFVFAVGTYFYVKTKLLEEQKAWEEEIAEKSGAMQISDRGSD